METKISSVAGGVVLNTNGDVLVVSQHGDSWSLPKGHVDEGEDTLAAAIREIQEESGISDLVFVKPLGNYERHRIGKDGIGDDLSELKQMTMYLFTTPEMELAPEDPENPEARWVAKDEVATLLTHPKDAAFFTLVQNNLDI